MGRATVLVLCCVAALGWGRYIRSSTTLSDTASALQVAGFALGAGQGRWELRVKLSSAEHRSSPLLFALVGYNSAVPPDELTCALGNNTNQQTVTFPVPSDFTYTRTMETLLPTQSSAVHWSFYLLYCASNPQQTVKIRYTLVLKGDNDVLYSVEENSLEDVYLYVAILYALGLIYSLYTFLCTILSEHGEDTEGFLIFQCFALILTLIGMVFLLIHYSKAVEDGKGWGLFRFSGQILELAGEMAVLISMLCVANGLFLRTKTPNSVVGVTIASTLAGFCLFLMVIFDNLLETNSIKTLYFHGIMGKLEVLVKMSLLCLHLRLISKNIQFQPIHIQQFFRKFRFMTTFLFSSSLISAFFSLLFPIEMRLVAFIFVSKVLFLLAFWRFLRLISELYRENSPTSGVLPSSKPHNR